MIKRSETVERSTEVVQSQENAKVAKDVFAWVVISVALWNVVVNLVLCSFRINHVLYGAWIIRDLLVKSDYLFTEVNGAS